MSYFQSFPNTNFYNQDLGWLIKKYKELNGDIKVLLQIYDMIKEQIKDITIEQLQEWLDDGTLENIIENLILDFTIVNNVNEMINLNLKENTKVITLNYLSNDNGGAEYIISTTPDIFNLKLNNGLYANIIIKNVMSTNQFGIFGDGTDYTDKINIVLNFIKNKCSTFCFDYGTYNIQAIDVNKQPNEKDLFNTGGIILPSNIVIDLCNSTLNVIANNHISYQIFMLFQVENVHIKNGILIGDRDTHFGEFGGEFGFGINIRGSENITIENLNISKMWGDCIITINTFETSPIKDTKNVTIKNCTLSNSRRQGISICSGINVIIKDNVIENINGTNPQSGIDIEPSDNDCIVDGVYIQNNVFNNNIKNLQIDGKNVTNNVKNIIISENIFNNVLGDDRYSLSITGNTDIVSLINNVFNGDVNNINIILLYKDCVIKNNIMSYVTIQSYSSDCNIDITGNTFTTNNLILLLTESNYINFFNNAILKAGSQIFVIYNPNTVNIVNNLIKDVNETRKSYFNVVGTPYVNFFHNILTNPNAYDIDTNTLPNNFKGSRGAMALNTRGNLNNIKAFIGDITYDLSSGKFKFYNGTTWVDLN